MGLRRRRGLPRPTGWPLGERLSKPKSTGRGLATQPLVSGDDNGSPSPVSTDATTRGFGRAPLLTDRALNRRRSKVLPQTSRLFTTRPNFRVVSHGIFCELVCF